MLLLDAYWIEARDVLVATLLLRWSDLYAYFDFMKVFMRRIMLRVMPLVPVMPHTVSVFVRRESSINDKAH